MSSKIGRCIGWLLGTLIILVPIALLFLIVGLVLKIALAAFGAVAVAVGVLLLLFACVLLKSAVIKQ